MSSDDQTEFTPRKLLFKAWNEETRLMMRLNNIECVKGELFRKGHVLLQYTGLNDQRGDEIYEMDIVLIASNKFVVRWDEAQSGWGLMEIGGKGRMKTFQADMAKDVVRLCSYFEADKAV